VRRVQRAEAPLRDYHGVEDGLRGLRFVAAAVESARRGAVWVRVQD